MLSISGRLSAKQMKIYQKWFSAGWCAACILLCVRTHPTKDRLRMYDRNTRLFDPETIDDYGFEEEESAIEIVEDSLEEFEGKGPTTMRAITTRAKNNVLPVLLPLIIEPEAEMLPPGYKSVKPPGVSHMELVLARPQIDSSSGDRRSATLRASTKGKRDRFHQPDDDADYAASRRETQITRDDRGGDSRAVSEVSSKGDSKKESKRGKYSERSGVRKSHSENEDRAKKHKKKVAKKKGSTYEARDDREKAHNAAGYRNVYHKDEFNKDADYYDNEREGGHFENHGRYGEKHAVAEGTYAKGKKRSQIDRDGSQ